MWRHKRFRLILFYSAHGIVNKIQPDSIFYILETASNPRIWKHFAKTCATASHKTILPMLTLTISPDESFSTQ
jgi:hypothetical protein